MPAPMPAPRSAARHESGGALSPLPRSHPLPPLPLPPLLLLLLLLPLAPLSVGTMRDGPDADADADEDEAPPLPLLLPR